LGFADCLRGGLVPVCGVRRRMDGALRCGSAIFGPLDGCVTADDSTPTR